MAVCSPLSVCARLLRASPSPIADMGRNGRFREVVARIEPDLSLRQNGPACTFNQRSSKIKRKTRILLYGSLYGVHVFLDVLHSSGNRSTCAVHHECSDTSFS